MEVLFAAGFQPLNLPIWYLRDTFSTTHPGFAFRDGGGNEIDLHWHVLHLDCRPNADESFWKRARDVVFEGQPTAVLDPADQVLHVTAHAAAWNPVSVLRWAADAMIILRKAGNRFAWDTLAIEACARGLAPPLFQALVALQSHLGLAVPRDVLRDLRRASGPLLRLEHRQRGKPIPQRPRWARLYLDILEFRRRREELMSRPLIATLLPYLRDRFSTRGLLQTAAVAMFHFLRRPGWLRRTLRIDRWARRPSHIKLPAVDTAIDMQIGHSPQPAFVDGWSVAENNGRWSIKTEARLAWTIRSDSHDDLICKISMTQFGPPSEPNPPVELWANDNLVDAWQEFGIQGDRILVRQFRIPATALSRSDVLVLTFAVGWLSSAVDIGFSDDPRTLGIFLHSLSITR